MIDLRWLTAFIDVPSSGFDRTAGFWAEVTGSSISPSRGAHGEFATFVPPSGDPYLRIQRLDSGDSAGIHLDLHVTDIGEARAEAEHAGARLVADTGHQVMASPAGLPFCLVSHEGERERTKPIGEPHLNVVDQVSIDVPHALFDRECSFWQTITGWPLRPGALEEFAFLVRPEGMPLRLLLQRLGETDPASTGRAHLDLACGERGAVVARRHEQLGARKVGDWRYWTTMGDPGGLPYCLTRRDPATGNLPG